MSNRTSSARHQIEATPNAAARSIGLHARKKKRILAIVIAAGEGRRMPGCVGASCATGGGVGGSAACNVCGSKKCVPVCSILRSHVNPLRSFRYVLFMHVGEHFFL